MLTFLYNLFLWWQMCHMILQKSFRFGAQETFLFIFNAENYFCCLMFWWKYLCKYEYFIQQGCIKLFIYLFFKTTDSLPQCIWLSLFFINLPFLRCLIFLYSFIVGVSWKQQKTPILRVTFCLWDLIAGEQKTHPFLTWKKWLRVRLLSSPSGHPLMVWYDRTGHCKINKGLIKSI